MYNDQLVLEYEKDYFENLRAVFTLQSDGHLRLLKQSKLERDIRNEHQIIIHGNQKLVIKHNSYDPFDLFDLKTDGRISLPYHTLGPITCACKVSEESANNDDNQKFRVMCLFETGKLYLGSFGDCTWTLLEQDRQNVLYIV
jgi:hypothetical protein